MAVNAPRTWLVTYDIANPRRLSRLHRFIKKHAVPVQYSVFYFEGSDAQLGRLMQKIECHYIDTGVDDVRAYQIPVDPKFDTLGRGSLPEALSLLSALNPLVDLLLHAPRA